MMKYQRIISFVCLLLLLSACDERSYGPKQADVPEPDAAAAGALEAAASGKISEPMLVVGDVSLPMPVPAGFKRLQAEHPLMQMAQRELGSEAVVLCIFERDDAHSGHARPSRVQLPLRQRETFLVSTLEKWLNIEVSEADFLKITKPWKEESIKFTQSTLDNFAKAATGLLANEQEFNYNLGLVDYSSAHVSFLRVEKFSNEEGQSLYSCSNTSLLWRNGKILNITCTSPITEFEQIHAVVAESVAYVQKLQNVDNSASREQADIESSAPSV